MAVNPLTIELTLLIVAAVTICIFVTRGFYAYLSRKIRRKKRQKRQNSKQGKRLIGREQEDAIARRRTKRVLRITKRISVCVVVCGATVVLAEAVALALTYEKPDNYRYYENPNASQTDISVLFDFETQKRTIIEQAEERKERKNHLHIPENFLNREISQDMFDYYTEYLEPIYANGTKTQYVPLDLPGSAEAEYNLIGGEYIEEAERYRKQYMTHPSLANQYHIGKNLNNAGLELDDMVTSVKIEVMSDAVFCLENVLIYENRNIGTKSEPYYVDAEWIGLLNGKLLLHNGRIMVSSVEGAPYANCFLVESLVIFELALNQIEEDNPYYAMLCYYVGESGDTILGRLDRNTDEVLYDTIGKKTMKAFGEAERCLKEDKAREENGEERKYKRETGMEEIIAKDIRTMEDMGFSGS